MNNQELQQSVSRLKIGGFALAVKPSGREARIIRTTAETSAWLIGEQVWHPEEMLAYVMGTPIEREIMRGLKGIKQRELRLK